MLYVLKDLFKSKSMILFVIFIIGISYIGGIDNKNLNNTIKNDVNIVEEVN